MARSHSQDSLRSQPAHGRPAEGGMRATARLVTVFLLGACVMFVAMAVSGGRSDSLLDALQSRHLEENLQHFPEPESTLRLLSTLGMGRYAEAVKRSQITIDVLASSSPREPEAGIQADDWRVLVMEARIMHPGTPPKGPPVQRRRPAEEAPEGGRGQLSQHKEQQQLHSPSSGFTPTKPTTPAAPATPTPAAPLVGRTGDAGAAHATGGGAVPAAPQASGKPPVCGGMARSDKLRDFYFETQRLGKRVLNATGLLPVPPACQGVSASPEDVPENWGPTRAHMSEELPVTAAAKEGRFIKQALTLRDVRELRARGVVEQLYIDLESRILYCVVPKAGCTTYKAWLLYNAGLYKGLGTVHKRSLYQGERVKNADFLPDDKILEILNGGEFFKFTVTRSPYTRALATYLERFHKCETLPKMTSVVCQTWRRALYGGYDKKVMQPIDTFKEFLDVMRTHYLPKVDFRNAHWVSSTRVCALDTLKYDWVGRLEDPTDTKVLYKLTGKPKTPYKTRGHSQSTQSKIPTYYNAENTLLVKEVFESTDVNLLGYTADGVIP